MKTSLKLVLTGFLITFVLLQGCTYPLKSDGEVKVWTNRPDMVLGDLSKSIPGLNVSFAQGTQSWYSLLKDPTARPDLILTELNTEVIMAQREGLFLDLTELQPRMETSALRFKGINTDYFNKKLPWFIPANLQTWVLFYNSKVLSEAGVTVPKTLEELQTAFEILRKANKIPLALGSSFGWPALALASALDLRMNGSSAYVDFIQGKRTAEDETFDKVFLSLENWRTKGWIDPQSGLYNWPEAAIKLKEDQAGFFFHLASAANRFSEDDDIQWTIFPSISETVSDANLAAFQGWVISNQSTNPESALNLADKYMKEGLSGQLTGTQRISTLTSTTKEMESSDLTGLQKDAGNKGSVFYPTPDRILGSQQSYDLGQVFIRFFAPGSTMTAKDLKATYAAAMREK